MEETAVPDETNQTLYSKPWLFNLSEHLNHLGALWISRNSKSDLARSQESASFSNLFIYFN